MPTLEDIRRWHASTLVREGMVVAVAGGIDAEAAGKAVDALLGALPPGDGAVEVPTVEADFSPRTVVLRDPKIEKSTVALLGRLPPTADGGELEDVLAVTTLGAGDGSRLHESLRTTLRAGYVVQALLDSQTRALRGLLLYAELDTDKLTEARRAMREAYAAFVTDGPTEEEFEAARTRLDEGLRQMLETPSTTARSLVDAALDGEAAERVVALPDELETISAETVRARLAAVYPAADELLEVVLTPAADAIEGACVIDSIDAAADCD